MNKKHCKKYGKTFDLMHLFIYFGMFFTHGGARWNENENYAHNCKVSEIIVFLCTFQFLLAIVFCFVFLFELVFHFVKLFSFRESIGGHYAKQKLQVTNSKDNATNYDIRIWASM